MFLQIKCTVSNSSLQLGYLYTASEKQRGQKTLNRSIQIPYNTICACLMGFQYQYINILKTDVNEFKHFQPIIHQTVQKALVYKQSLHNVFYDWHQNAINIWWVICYSIFNHHILYLITLGCKLRIQDKSMLRSALTKMNYYSCLGHLYRDICLPHS